MMLGQKALSKTWGLNVKKFFLGLNFYILLKISFNLFITVLNDLLSNKLNNYIFSFRIPIFLLYLVHFPGYTSL